MYFAHIRTFLMENITNDLYSDRMDTMQAIIDAEVQADPLKFYTYADFQSNINNTVSGIYGIAQLMDSRDIYLNALPELTAIPPTIANIITPAAIAQNATITITAAISNATNAYIGIREKEIDRFIKTPLFDDGAHNDGAAGDGIYGTAITLGLSDLQYYIYAENVDAGMFSPVRAEYEFYDLVIEKGIAINEVMAVNSSYVTDQDGEFDDWIELYNNSSSAVVLDGYYLTDNAAELTKWTFPLGTTVDANDYLIIWADKDTSQTGLHANFKLSGAGESLTLSDNNLKLVDEINFGAQTSDISYGRYVNGTGSFTLMTPSYKAFNAYPLSVKELVNSTNFNLYPNPAEHSFKMESNSKDDLAFRVFNAIGQLVYSGTLNHNETKTIGVETWNAGFYFIRFEDGKSLKLLVNK
jgi:hypothetical protein